jgi:hypothetical protein
MLEKIIKDEPLRLRLYSLAVLVLGYLVARGLVSPTDAEFIGGVIVVVLGVESARQKVTPAAKVHTTVDQFHG